MLQLFLSKEHFETQLCYARRKFELLEQFSQFIAISSKFQPNRLNISKNIARITPKIEYAAFIFI